LSGSLADSCSMRGVFQLLGIDAWRTVTLKKGGRIGLETSGRW
jgi:hypothetical protein